MPGRIQLRSSKKSNPASQLVTACLDLLRLRGCYAFRVNTQGVWDGERQLYRTFTGTKGVSDILGCWRGKFIAVEVKFGTGRLSKEQKTFLDDVVRAGGLAFVARSVDQLDAALKLEGIS